MAEPMSVFEYKAGLMRLCGIDDLDACDPLAKMNILGLSSIYLVRASHEDRVRMDADLREALAELDQQKAAG